MTVETERFGQCVPADATARERIEAASALLCLASPSTLLEALRDSGLTIVPAADVNTTRFDGEFLHWPGGGMNLAMLRALLDVKKLAIVPAADVPPPISDETLRHLRECALAWEPEARLLGNVTAHQLRSFCLELARLRAGGTPRAEGGVTP